MRNAFWMNKGKGVVLLTSATALAISLFIVYLLFGSCSPKSWTLVAANPPTRSMTIEEIVSKGREGKVGFSVRSDGQISKVYTGGVAVIVVGKSGEKCFAVLVGLKASAMSKKMVTGRKITFDAAVTRLIDDSLYGKLMGVPHKDLRSFAGSPLLQIYNLYYVSLENRSKGG